MPLPPTVAPARRDTVRLIVAGRLGAVLLPLAADPEALDDLSDLEGATDRQLQVWCYSQ